MARSRPLALPPGAIDRWAKHANGTVSHIAESTGFVNFDLSFNAALDKRVVSPEHYIVTFAHRTDKGRPRSHSSLLTLRIVPEELLPSSVPVGVEVRGRDGEAIICKGEYIEFELQSKFHEASSQPPLKIAAGPVRVNAETQQREFMRIDLGRCVRHIVTDVIDDPVHPGQKLSRSRWWICIEVLRLVCTTNSLECAALDDPKATPLEWVICLIDERAAGASADAQSAQEKTIDELARLIEGGGKKNKGSKKKKKGEKPGIGNEAVFDIDDGAGAQTPLLPTDTSRSQPPLSKSAAVAAALSSKDLRSGVASSASGGASTQGATAALSGSAGLTAGASALAPRPAPPPGWSRTVDLSPALIDSWRDVAGCEVRHIAEATGFIYFAVNIGADSIHRHVSPAHYVVAFPNCGGRQQRYHSALLSLRIVLESEIADDALDAAKPTGGSADCVEFELLSRENESVLQTPLRITTGPVRVNERTGQRESMRLDLGVFVRRAAPDLVMIEGVSEKGGDGKQPERLVRQRWWIGLDTLRLVCISNALECSGLDTPGVAPLEWVICLVDDRSAVSSAMGAPNVQRPIVPQPAARPSGGSLSDELRNLVEGIGRVVGGTGGGLGGLGGAGGGLGGFAGLGSLGELGGLGGLSSDPRLSGGLSASHAGGAPSVSAGTAPGFQSAIAREVDMSDATKKKKKKKKKKTDDEDHSDEGAGTCSAPQQAQAAAMAQAAATAQAKAKTQGAAKAQSQAPVPGNTQVASGSKKGKSSTTPALAPAAQSAAVTAQAAASKKADNGASKASEKQGGGQSAAKSKAAGKASVPCVNGLGKDQAKASPQPNRTLALPSALIDSWCQYAQKNVAHVAEVAGFVHFELKFDEDKARRVLSPENYIIAFPHKDKGRQRYHSSLLTLRLVPESDIPKDAIRSSVEKDADTEHVEFELLSRVHEAPVQQPLRITAGPVRLNPETGQRESMRIDLGRCVRQISTDVIDDSHGKKLVRSRWWVCVDTLRLVCTANSLDSSALDTPGAPPLEWVICLADERAMQHEGEANSHEEQRDIDALVKFIDGGKSSSKKKKAAKADNMSPVAGTAAAPLAATANHSSSKTPTPSSFAPRARGPMAAAAALSAEDEFHSPLLTPDVAAVGGSGVEGPLAQLEALLSSGSLFNSAAYDLPTSAAGSGTGRSLLSAWETEPSHSRMGDDFSGEGMGRSLLSAWETEPSHSRMGDDFSGLSATGLAAGLNGGDGAGGGALGGLDLGSLNLNLGGAGGFGSLLGPGGLGLDSRATLDHKSLLPADGLPSSGSQAGLPWESLLAGLCSEFAQASQDALVGKRWEPDAGLAQFPDAPQ